MREQRRGAGLFSVGGGTMRRRSEEQVVADGAAVSIAPAAHSCTSMDSTEAIGEVAQAQQESHALLPPEQVPVDYEAHLTSPRDVLVRKWPSELMKRLNENDDDEWLSVMERIRSHPEEIPQAGRNGGQTSLHAACVRYPPIHVIEAMLDSKPEVGAIQNFSGETPLHLACSSASEEVQELLIHRAPEAVSMVDQYGDCPLHLAARWGATYPLMELLLTTAPHCVSIKNIRGVTPIWLLPRKYLEVESFDEIFEEDDEYVDDWNRLCLFLKHSYLMRGAMVPELPDPDDDDSDAIPPRDAFAWIVHAAAATPSCPREVLRFLCRIFPEQALVRDSLGLTPLLHACMVAEMDEPENWNEDEDGFREHVAPSEGQLENEMDRVPEEERITEQGDGDFIHEMIQAEVGGEEDESAIGILLTWSPRSSLEAAPNGRLPLAAALASGQSWSSIRRLIVACPRGIECVDPVTRFPMFQLAAQSAQDLDTVYSLLRGSPSFL